MPTLVPYLDSPNPTALKPDVADYEPDEVWKYQVKKRIEESLESMVKDVKENQAAQLRKEVVTPETRMCLEEEYKQAMANIKALANDQYLLELDRERNQRRWLRGAPVSAEWGRILAEEQQGIMNTIKNNQDDKASTASPTDERNPPQPTKPEAVPRESTKPPRSASLRVPPTPHPVLEPKEERDKPASTPTDSPSARRGSDAKATLSRDREDRSRSRRHHSTSHSRGSLPDSWEPPVEKASKDNDQPEEPPHRPPPRSRPSAEQPPSSPEVTRRDTLQGRSNSLRSGGGSFTARSPPKLVPEVWKPSASEDDPPGPRSYDLGRRGSSASMKSTASGTGVRPIISATIPERIDDAEGPSPAEPTNYEQDKSRKHRDKERRGGRKNSRPTPVEPPSYADDIQVSSSLRSAGTTSLVMQMATSSTPIKALSSKPSFTNGEDRYYRDAHPPLRDVPPPREPPYPNRDIPPNARPGHVRSPYGPEERDYNGPHQTSHRPPKTTFREYPPGPHQPYEERRRDRDREGEWEHDFDDEYGREYEHRDWDRDPYPESRHHGHYPYSARSGSYPVPPTSATRHPQDYDHDDRDAPTHGYGYRGHVPTSSPVDEWDHSRPDGTRPAPTRQPSYRRDDPERDPYSRTYTSAGGIPIASRRAPSNEDLGGPAWKEWGLEARRASDSRHEGYPRSPPASEQFPRRRHQYYNGDLPRDDASLPLVRHRKRPHLADYDHDKEGHSSDDEENDDGRSETDESEEDMSAQAKKLEEDWKLNERIQGNASEIKRLQEMEKRLEEEARRKDEGLRQTFKRQEEAEEKRAEEEARKKVEEMEREAKRKEEELRKKNREAQRKEQEAKRKVEDAKKLVLEAGRKEEEAKKKEKEVRRKEEEVKEEAEKAKQLQQEAVKQAEAARLRQDALRQLEEETRRKEQEIEARERALRVREEELKIREEEAQRREEEAWQKDEESRKKEAEVKRKEKEAKRREEEVKRKEEDAKKKEEEARRKEEEVKRREQEAAAKILEEKARQDRRMYDPERFFDDLDDADAKFIEEQTRLLQQAQYRKREEEIKRNREERKRQDSVGNESAWAAPGSSPGVAKSFPQFAAAPQYNNGPSPSPSSAAWTTWGSPPSKVPGPATPSNGRSASSSTVPPLNKPRNGSVSSGSHPMSTSPHSATPITESEWARRHAEFTNNQQERFRREQEKLEAERQLRAAGKPLTRDEVLRLMEHHDRLWTRLSTINELMWTDFPWPVLRTTMNADDITFILVSNYFQSPLLPDKDKSRSPKDRIKEHLRRWHPDRFESKVLPRVIESEKEKVKQGAGNVVRCLNDLLRKENETGNTPSPFGE